MKKVLAVMVMAISLFMVTTPSYAADWPPEEYKMPRVVVTQEQVKDSLSGLKTTIRSCVNIGLVIFGILTSIALIPRIFKCIVLGSFPSSSSSGGFSDHSYWETKL